MAAKNAQVPSVDIDRLILRVRGQRVLLDEHLGSLYGVDTKRLNEQVTRNLDRFPDDFMFRLNPEEWAALKSQIATSNASGGRGGRRKLPRVFTEQGVAMLSSVLRSRRAVHVNIAIMRTFVQIRRLGQGEGGLLARLDKLEERVGAHDAQFQAVFRAVRRLIEGPSTPDTQRIGFTED